MAYQSKTNLYAHLGQLRRLVGLDNDSDSADDAALVRVLEQVSRSIDNYCRTQFYVTSGTFDVTPTAGRVLLPWPLISASALSTDDGTRTYATTWAPSDYDLLPIDAPTTNWPPQPYWEIGLAPYGSQYSFGRYPRGLRITGKRGQYEVLARSPLTVAEALDASETDVTLSSAPTPAGELGVGSTILVDDEQMAITALDGVTATVIRRLNGTTAATHLTGAAIDIYQYPVVDECCLMQAADDWRYRSILGGERSSDEIGEATASHAWLPRVREKLWPLRSGLGMVA